MITRIEIDGFKTFRNLALDIAPFQAIVGANGAGKSNLFDAITLLSSLADSDIRTAFRGMRGEPSQLFTIFPDGSSLPRMRLAVEMLVEPRVEDSWGARADVRYTRMRYEVAIEQRADERGVERLYVTHEALLPIQRSGDPWARRHIGRSRELWLPALKSGRTVPFISTGSDDRSGTVFLHQDGRGGDMAAVAHAAERTVLSTIANTEFPHAFAAREEMRSWRVIDLDPSAVRASGLALPHTFIGTDGGNLAAALGRMKGENPALIGRISRELSEIIHGVAGIDLDERRGYDRQEIRFLLEGGGIVPLPLVSDAALRLLALVALKNDPDGGALLCLEEPENGLDEYTLRCLARFLHGAATDFSSTEPDPFRLRQMIVATHSTGMIMELMRFLSEREEGPVHELPELLFAQVAMNDDPWEPGATPVTRFARIRPSQQLELALDSDVGDAPVYTFAEIEESLRGADARRI